LEVAIVKGIYIMLRKFHISISEIMTMPSPRFWVLIELLQEESKKREKQMKKNRKK